MWCPVARLEAGGVLSGGALRASGLQGGGGPERGGALAGGRPRARQLVESAVTFATTSTLYVHAIGSLCARGERTGRYSPV